jgi:YVTN family beta-propeller protein
VASILISVASVGRGAHARPSRRAARGVIAATLVTLLAGGVAIAFAAHRDAGATPVGVTPGAPAASPPVRLATAAKTITTVPGPPPGSAPLQLLRVIGGPISPKSVDATGTGLVVAQNMMYRHTMTVYDSDGVLRKTIPDSVVFAHFSIPGHPGVSRGAPVEAAVTPDRTHLWVSNYSMYGVGFGPEGSDTCSASTGYTDGYTDSYLYRVSLRTLSIDGVAKVGWVPKYVAVTPSGRWVLATNWCSYDLSIVSTATLREVARIPIGPYPRGIAISPDSHYAYVAIMGGDSLDVVNLETRRVVGSIYTGSNPRHVVISPNGQFLYVTLNQPGEVVKILRRTGRILGEVHAGVDCRSLAISSNGTTLYVVNYLSDTMSTLRASDLKVLQTVPTGQHPVGITYDPVTGHVWVAVYTGAIMIFGTR